MTSAPVRKSTTLQYSTDNIQVRKFSLKLSSQRTEKVTVNVK